MVMLGTKWPSITSTWIQSAPAASTARTSSPSLAKSAARIDGAMSSGRIHVVRLTRRAHPGNAARCGPCTRCPSAGGGKPRASGLSSMRQQIDRKLRQREIEPGECRARRSRSPPASARYCGCRRACPMREGACAAGAAEHQRRSPRIMPERQREGERGQRRDQQRLVPSNSRARRPSRRSRRRDRQ